MFSHLKSVSLVALLATMLVSVSATAQAASTVVSISIPPTQQLEGSTIKVVADGAMVQRGQLVVKSNVPWVLVAHVDGVAGEVVWRSADATAWKALGLVTLLLRGPKGVHLVAYELQARLEADRGTGRTALVKFSLEPSL